MPWDVQIGYDSERYPDFDSEIEGVLATTYPEGALWASGMGMQGEARLRDVAVEFMDEFRANAFADDMRTKLTDRKPHEFIRVIVTPPLVEYPDGDPARPRRVE
jgi:hypothetical protein